MKRKVREKLDGKVMKLKREFDFIDDFCVDDNIDDSTKKFLMKKFCAFVHHCDRVVSYAEQNCSYVEMFDYAEKWSETLMDD